MYQPQSAITEPMPGDAEAAADPVGNLNVDALAADLYQDWQGRCNARRETEDEWLLALRNVKGEHSPEALARMKENDQLSQVFIRVTLTKYNAAYSRLIDMLFQQVDSFWDIVPSPMAALPKAVKTMVQRQARTMAITQAIQTMAPAEQKQAMVEQLTPVLEAQFEDAIMQDSIESAEKACLRIKRQIKDYLIEAQALAALKKTVAEACMLGTGCFKTATVKFLEREGWEMNDSDEWEMRSTKVITPDIEHVSCWEIYPNSWATDPKDPEDVIRRRVLTKTEFRQLADAPGFDEEAVRDVLRMSPQGNHQDLQWETDIRTINNTEDKSYIHSRRYDVFEYWGIVDGEELTKYGVKVADPLIEYQANIWFCNNRVLMARLNTLKPEVMPYRFVPYQVLTHRFWGVGIPEMMRDSQECMNASVNALLDNVALSAGPMFDVDVSMLPDGYTMEDAKKIYPYKVNFYDSEKNPSASGSPYRVHNIQTNQSQLQAVFEMFRRFADEETSLPSYTHGEQGKSMNKTASGMSMLMSAANVALKSVVKNIDDYLTTPLIESLYNFSMRWSDVEEKRGDLDVVAQGSSALMSKELYADKLSGVLAFTGNPVDGPMTNREYLLKQYFTALDLDPDKAMKSLEEIMSANGPVNGEGIAGAQAQPPVSESPQLPPVGA